jgi:hypothetical protein
MTARRPQPDHAAERTIVALDEGAAFDLAVLGAGAGGMAAAVFAALEGLRVILIERTEYLGGTTAYSGGTTWIPLTRHSAALGAEDSRAAASRFLDLAVGNRAPKELREAFLDAGPAAVEVLETRTEMKFRGRPFHPDYLSELQGATTFGRAIEPLPFEAAGLGADFALIRPPIPEFTILGGLSVDRDDIAHLLKMTRSPRSAAYAARLFVRYGLERLRWPRGTRLVMGNAMIGRLLASARKLGVVIATRAEVTTLRTDGGRVAGISVEQAGAVREIALRRGAVLAGGGFARHPGMRAALLPTTVPECSPSAPGHTGMLQEMALALGARQATTHDQPCFWAPVSVRAAGRDDGGVPAFRLRPGEAGHGDGGPRRAAVREREHVLSPVRQGDVRSEPRRIDDPGLPDRRCGGDEEIRARHGAAGRLGPAGGAGGRLCRAGRDAGGTDRAPGVDAAGLEATVAEMNVYAGSGVDAAFGRGSTVYQRANGDASHGPNPTLGPIGTAPFHAVRLWPGDIGSSVGLVTDAQARVLGPGEAPIDGLWAVGNDMASIMGGSYPAGGINLGPAMTFGFIAGRDLAGLPPLTTDP